MKDLKAIGNRIRQKRKALGYTQETMAPYIGYTSQYLSNVERGGANPSEVFMDKVCEFLKCDRSELDNDTIMSSDLYHNEEVIRMYRKLAPDSKKLVLDFMTVLLHNQEQAERAAGISQDDCYQK